MNLCDVRLRFLGKVLAVERASKVAGGTKHQDNETQTNKNAASIMKDSATQGYSDSSRGGYNHSREPIAEKLGLDYPFPPHLEYVILLLGALISFLVSNLTVCSLSASSVYSLSYFLCVFDSSKFWTSLSYLNRDF